MMCVMVLHHLNLDDLDEEVRFAFFYIFLHVYYVRERDFRFFFFFVMI